ncbi:MAG: hypothetical protein HOH19_05610 [Kordiimonadaceae bacterium]|jgi:peptidyl-prolyl cis-trans isomerase C|nr:hypothetical protein [Kordiimonadaceae bacterium]MBT6032032.1 hypothetical protein [Kordiimonadaceae bacterium]
MPVIVNNTEITDDQVHLEMQHHPAPTVEDAKQEAARALIIRQLLLEAAANQDIITEEVIQEIDNEKEEIIIETLLDEVINVPTADDETCQRYYDQHTSKFVDKKTGAKLPYSMVQNHIKTYLEDKGHMSAFNAYIDDLMDKAQIVTTL